MKPSTAIALATPAPASTEEALLRAVVVLLQDQQRLLEQQCALLTHLLAAVNRIDLRGLSARQEAKQ